MTKAECAGRRERDDFDRIDRALLRLDGARAIANLAGLAGARPDQLRDTTLVAAMFVVTDLLDQAERDVEALRRAPE